MTKFKTLPLLIGLFTTFSSFSQNVEVINGKPFLLTKKRESIINVLNTSKENFSFLTKVSKNSYKVVTLDNKLGLESSKDIVLPEVKGKEVKFISASKMGDKTFFFSRSFDKKTDTYTLYASELNLKTAKFDKHIEVLKAQDDKFSNFYSPFEITQNIDSTKIAFSVLYPTKGKENAKYGFVITDNNLNQLWKNDIIFDQLDKNFSVNNFLIDTKGNVHITATVRMDKDDKKEKGAASRYYQGIYSYFFEENNLIQYELGFKDEIILSSNFKLNEKDELVCTGFYGEKKLFDAGYKGFFYMRIDPTSKKVVAKNLSPFDKKFLGELMSARKAEKGKGLTGYLVRETFNNSDGGMTVVCEYYQYYETRDQNGNLTSQTWIYGNVLVFFLDKEGKMDTYSILKKNQIARNVYGNLLSVAISAAFIPTGMEVPYYGVGCMMKDDNLQLIYNENPKNAARLKADKKPKSVRQRTSETVLVQLSREGKINANTLFKSKDKAAGFKMPVMPQFHYNYSKDAMIVIGKKGKNVRMVNIEVKK
jgi:hypothetical protein